MDPTLLEKYSSELMILTLSALVLGTVLYLVPQLLRIYSRQVEIQHAEHVKALEQGQEPYRADDRIRSAGRIAALVPMVVVCAASVVTCFLTVCKSDNLFAVTLAVWSVAGVVSLASIISGVQLMVWLANLEAGVPNEPAGPPPPPNESDRERSTDTV